MTSYRVALTSLFAVGILFVIHQPELVASEVDVWQEMAEIEVFKLKDSSEGCPAWFRVMSCPTAGIFVFYKCCGTSCCRRFQGWLLGLLGLVIALYVLRALVNLISDVFCCRYRQWKKERARKNRREVRRRIRTSTEDNEEDDNCEALREVVTPPCERSSRRGSIGRDFIDEDTPRRSREVEKKKHKGLFSGWRCERRQRSRDRRRKQPDGVADTTTQEWIKPTAPGVGTQPPS